MIIIKIQALAEALNQVLTHDPQAPAVVHRDQTKSYQQLMETALDIAAQLRNMGIQPGQRLALSLPRSIALYEVMIACLMLEISFVSLPRGLDKSKQITMANKAKCVGILSNTDLFPQAALSIHPVGKYWRLSQPTQKSSQNNTFDKEVYCVRSSGTTGEPKVIPINISQLSAFLDNSKQILAVADHKRWLWMHDLSFDFSIWELMGCLMHRGCVVVLDENQKRDPQASFRYIAKHNVNVVSGTPSEFRFLFSSDETQTKFSDLHLTDLIFGGEKLSTNTLQLLFQNLNRQGLNWHHIYGPTETTVFCAYYQMTEADLGTESIPFGVPFPGTEFELLTTNDPGLGELKIRGLQVFEGYDGGEKLTDGYDTGDVCRRDEQGRYLFVRRLSGYQKINGFRVDPFEVEEFLQSHPQVVEAVVVVKNTSHQGDYLIACVRVPQNVTLSTRELRLTCSKLPPYLRPTQYLLLTDEKWPMNERGKTDRNFLKRNVYETN